MTGSKFPYVGGFRMLVADFIQDIYRKQRIIRPNTVEHYLAVVESFSRYLGRQATLDDLARQNVEGWLQHELAREMSIHTMKSRRQAICVLWRASVRYGAPAFDSPVRLKSPKIIVVALGNQKVLRLIDEARCTPGMLRGTKIPIRIYWPAFIAAAFETALRTSDMLQLRYDPSGKWVLLQRKTGKPVSVSVSPTTLEMVASLHKCNPGLFSVARRREWYPKSLRKISARVGIYATPQQLRRSAASECERQCPGSAWIRLGHDSPLTTQKWYIDESHAYTDLPRPRIQW